VRASGERRITFFDISVRRLARLRQTAGMGNALFQPFPMPGGRRAQVWRHQPQYRRPRHFHAEPEINLVVKGSAVVGVGRQTLNVSAGALLLFEPGQDHVLLGTSDDFDLFVMALKPELASRVRSAPALPWARRLRLDAPELAGIAARLGGLHDVSDASAVEFHLAEMFAQASQRPLSAHVVSRRALARVNAELGVSGSALARQLKVAPSALSRRFHRDLGVPFVEYRARLRLMRFVELVDRGLALSRAAFDAGFGSYAQCHRVFQHAVGCAPQDYFGGTRTLVDAATFSGT
jgi:AraC-like DNA-binding protein/mannose-6-phosphate isomerase-like protein (cupin superfamily)